MPATTQATHNGITITFTEEDHSYVDDRGEVYTSATTFLKRFFEPFDADKTAARMESQGRGDAEKLKAKWAAKGAVACDYGTRVHETAEAILLGSPVPHQPRNEKERAAFSLVRDFCHTSILANFEVVACELLVFSPDRLIAGTLDLLLRTPDHARYIICDWKSNEKIATQGFQGRKALYPIDHMQDCDFTKYTLQLNTYETLLLEEGHFGDDRPIPQIDKRLFWVKPDGSMVQPIAIDRIEGATDACLDKHRQESRSDEPDCGQKTGGRCTS
jgi:ATP-dependent exoDNAse (exonuclease V) beta subunit